MKRALLLSPLLLVALAACTEEEPADAPLVEAPTTLSTAPQATLPPDPQPAADGPCPYLEDSFVEQANAQRVGKVQVSADQPPTCFFYRRNGDLQVTVRVYTGDATVAKALVDAAAPVATANPAELSGGWQGGAESKDAGAVYAVAKDGSAVIVTIDHKQTIKARQIAQQSITGLGL